MKRCSNMCSNCVWINYCRLRSKIWWFTGFCNSHYVSHFAAFFIVARTKISVVKSRNICYKYTLIYIDKNIKVKIVSKSLYVSGFVVVLFKMFFEMNDFHQTVFCLLGQLQHFLNPEMLLQDQTTLPLDNHAQSSTKNIPIRIYKM